MNRIVPLLRRLRHPSSFIPRGLTLLALIALGWTAAYVEIMLLLTWPWPTLVMTALIVGFVAGAIVAVQLRGLALEPVQQRKDTAIDAAFDTAFELQRVSGEHPTLQEPTDGEAIEPPYDWALDYSETSSVSRAAPNPWAPADHGDLLALNLERSWRLRDREADR